MTRLFSGLGLTAAGLALMVAAAPHAAQAGGAIDELRARGLGTWVDHYVEKDSTGNVRYKRSTASKGKVATLKTSKLRSLKAKAPKTTALKGKTLKRKLATTTTTRKLTTSSANKKTYKVPASVSDRLASYGIKLR